MHQVLLHPLANKELNSLEKSISYIIMKKLHELKEFPERSKPLRHVQFRSLRIGDYRAIYEVVSREKKVTVLFVGHMKNVYTDFSKLF